MPAGLLAGRRRPGEPRCAARERRCRDRCAGRARAVIAVRVPRLVAERARRRVSRRGRDPGRARSPCRGSSPSSASTSTVCRCSTACSRPACTAPEAQKWRCITVTITGSTACCFSSLRSCCRASVPSIRARRLRLLLAAYLSLMAAYGLGNMANDFWTEQIWKRGWTNWQFPNLLQPSLSVGWGAHGARRGAAARDEYRVAPHSYGQAGRATEVISRARREPCPRPRWHSPTSRAGGRRDGSASRLIVRRAGPELVAPLACLHDEALPA